MIEPEKYIVNWKFPVGDGTGNLILDGIGLHPTCEDIRTVIEFCEIACRQMARIEEPKVIAEQERIFATEITEPLNS